MSSFSQPQWPAWAYTSVPDPFAPYGHMPEYPAYLADSMEAYQVQQNHLVHHHHMARATESKPRLSKEEVEILEAEFQKNHKPNSSTKKALAESMRVDHARINNWFQNRRAREKKENNIREYEARQKLEKEKAVANGTNQSDSDRKSSAPFPETTQTSQLPTDHHSEQHTPLSTDDEHIASDQDEDIKSEDVSEDTRDYFGDYQGMTPRVTRDPQVFSSSLFPGENHFAPDSLQQSHMQYHGSAYLDQSAPASFVTPGTTEDAVTKSSSLDIASRRSRRPPPLSINGSRSYSAVPKTTADLAMRAEPGCAMRRVSSANGTVRITKTSATPRSPYLQRNNSPSRTGTGAPPTPDTPIVATMQDLNNHAAISSTYALNNKFSVLNQDPTLRTPPTTPGIMDGFFNVNSAYGMTVSDETLMTPSVGSYASEFEIPSATTTTSSYMGLLGNSTDYYWSDASTSGRSSPALNTNHVQYMNINAPTFGHVAS